MPTKVNPARRRPGRGRGQAWWEQQGRPGFKGLKFVSISGDVHQAGVYEIPAGATVAQLIGLAGGMKEGSPLKAFLPGGPSSNFLPAGKADTPLDFDRMQAAGSMLGSAGIIVFGRERNLFALATNLVRFFAAESCGKCVPCRGKSAHSPEKRVISLERGLT